MGREVVVEQMLGGAWRWRCGYHPRVPVEAPHLAASETAALRGFNIHWGQRHQGQPKPHVRRVPRDGGPGA